MSELGGAELLRGAAGALTFLALFAAARVRFAERGPAHGPADNGLD